MFGMFTVPCGGFYELDLRFFSLAGRHCGRWHMREYRYDAEAKDQNNPGEGRTAMSRCQIMPGDDSGVDSVFDHQMVIVHCPVS